MKERISLIRPNSKLGLLSVLLIITMPILFAIGSSLADSTYAQVAAGDSIMQDIASRPALAITMLTGMVAGVSAFITGVLAVFRKKERSILVYLSTFLGAGLILFLVAEFIAPH